MTTAAPTREQIKTAILDALAPTGSTTLVPWGTVRLPLPGSWWAQTQALTDLFERYEVSMVKVRGRCYVRLADDYDRWAAAAARDRAAETGWPLPRCRNVVMV